MLGGSECRTFPSHWKFCWLVPHSAILFIVLKMDAVSQWQHEPWNSISVVVGTRLSFSLRLSLGPALTSRSFWLCFKWSGLLPSGTAPLLSSHQSHVCLPISSLPGDPPANEEGIHPGVLPRQKVHVCLLLPSQIPGCCGQQDVRQGQKSERPLPPPLLPNPKPLSHPCLSHHALEGRQQPLNAALVS